MSDEQPKTPTDDMRKRQRYAIAGITDLLNEFDLPEHCADAGECLRNIGAYVLMGLDTRHLLGCEHRLDLARKQLAETCKELLAVEKLIEPEES